MSAAKVISPCQATHYSQVHLTPKPVHGTPGAGTAKTSEDEPAFQGVEIYESENGNDKQSSGVQPPTSQGGEKDRLAVLHRLQRTKYSF